MPQPNTLPWYHIAILSIAATLLLIFIVYHGVKTIKNRNNKCTTNSDSETCDNAKCNKMIKKDLNHLLILFVVVLCFVLTNLFHSDANAMNYFSFASTIASIILSVVAIIFSITGETRTESLKHMLDDAARKLEKTTSAMQTRSEDQKQVFDAILTNSQDILNKTNAILDKANNIEERVREVNSNLINKEMAPSDSTYKSVTGAKEDQ